MLLRVFEEVERVLPQAGTVAEVGRLATMLEGLLSGHAELEVEFAFAALDHALYRKGRLTRLHQDHAELDERLRQMHAAETCERARGLLRGAMRAGRAHFRQEERELFPAVERALGLGVLSALGERFRKKGRKARTKRGF